MVNIIAYIAVSVTHDIGQSKLWFLPYWKVQYNIFYINTTLLSSHVNSNISAIDVLSPKKDHSPQVFLSLNYKIMKYIFDEQN